MNNQNMRVIAGRVVSVAAFCALAASFVGCGSAGTSPTRKISKAVAKLRALQAARSIRNTVSTAALGSRVAAGVATSTPHRAEAPDPTTGYFFTESNNADGTVSVSLFTDSAHTTPAGTIQVSTPTWTGGVKGSFPVTYQLSWNVTAGSYTGTKGATAVVVKDASGQHEVVHETLTDLLAEAEGADLAVDNGTVTGTEHATLSDGSSEHADVAGSANGDGSSTANVQFEDGTNVQTTEHQDGSVDVSVADPDNVQQATGHTDQGGGNQVNFNDGSTDNSNSVELNN